MYRVLAAASLVVSFGFAAAAFPAQAGGSHAFPRIKPIAQPVIANPGIGVLHQPRLGQHFRHHVGHHRNFGNFGNLGLGSGFLIVEGLNGTGAGSNTNTIINNVSVGLGGSGAQAVAGIREAPPMRPAIYVIDEAGEGRQRTQRQGGARVVELGAAGWAELDETPAQDGYGPRIIRVPAR